LATKLQELQASLESEKLDRQGLIDAKFRNLDERLQQQQFTQESRFKVCVWCCYACLFLVLTWLQLVKDELTGLEEKLQNCRVEREVPCYSESQRCCPQRPTRGVVTAQILDERNSKAIKDIESGVRSVVLTEQQAFKDSEAQLVKVVDDKFYGLAVELADTRRRREEAEGRIGNLRQDQISRLTFNIDHEQHVMYVFFASILCESGT
jgi:hypothetical protein